MSHDRLAEASYFLREMEGHYHDPKRFRFNLNAYLAAVRATIEILQKEMERLGRVQEWKERSGVFKRDDVLSRFALARNATLHQSAIYDGSKIQAGMFRGRKLKLAMASDVSHDHTTQEILQRVQATGTGFFIDEEHSALAEQLGVDRKYWIGQISKDEDVLSACRRAFARMTRVMEEAHNMFEMHAGVIDENDILNPAALREITVLLETDVDPGLIDTWGWND